MLETTYGGKLDSCLFINCSSAVVYRKLINLTSHPLTAVSSHPRRPCFCNKQGEPDCNTTNETTQPIYPGEVITVEVVAVGQFDGTVPSTIASVFK